MERNISLIGDTPNLIVIRGASASGKTTVATALKQRLLHLGFFVTYLPWDTFFHFLEPAEIGLYEILATTRTVVQYAREAVLVRNADFVILDGVFVYEEEINTILSLHPLLSPIYTFKLSCEEAVQLDRNQTRNPEDVLDNERVKLVTRMREWEASFPDELYLDTTHNSPDKIVDIILDLISVSSKKQQDYCSVDANSSFTLRQDWQWGNLLRYGHKRIINLCGLPFVVSQSISTRELTALTYFDFPVSDDTLEGILKEIKQDNAQVHFKYLNQNSSALQKLRTLEDDLSVEIQVVDSWDAPLLEISGEQTFATYLQERPYRLRRTLQKIVTAQTDRKIFFRSSHYSNLVQLWCDTQEVDLLSWKTQEQSDMRSLEREDLTYFVPLTIDPDNNSLLVLYTETRPMAFSLMSRTNRFSRWFAVKWGCTESGRKNFLGITCLLEHLELLYNLYRNRLNQSVTLPFEVDFWGRRSEIYNQLATSWVRRCNIVLMNKNHA